MTPRLVFVVSLAICSCTLVAGAADWPQWRGPERNGISKETGLLRTWPQEGPKLLWHVKDAGDGYSTPSIKGDHIYLLGNKGMKDEYVQARDIKDGQIIWTTHLGKVGLNRAQPYPGCRSTPTVDGERVFVLSSDGDLVCVKSADGGEIWRKSLPNDFGGEPGLWAYAESPLIDGDVLVCTPGGKEATLVALNKKNGAVIWKTPVPDGDKAAYASVIIVEVGGLKQYVQFLGKGVVGVDAKTGKFLWRYDKTADGSPANIPTPVADGGYVYSSTGKGGGGLIKLKVEKDGIATAPVYHSMVKLPTSIGGAIIHNHFLYGTNNSGLMCVEFTTGKQIWQQDGGSAGAVCYADGRLYVHLENGDMILVEATPEAYRELGRFTPPDLPERGAAKAWTYPVIANGRLYVRDLGVLWCYDLNGAK
jgi:outer membrane protein assembly factor BamB